MLQPVNGCSRMLQPVNDQFSVAFSTDSTDSAHSRSWKQPQPCFKCPFVELSCVLGFFTGRIKEFEYILALEG